MDTLAQIIDAAAALAWPLLAAIVLLKFYPVLRKIVESRGFTVKVGDMEVSVQEASEQLRTQVEDLQRKVSELRAGGPAPPAAPVGAAPPPATAAAAPAPAPAGPRPARPRRVLWVDDQPSNNAFEIARLRDDGVDVVEVRSTREAMRVLGEREIDVVITDMGREEDDHYRPDAGLELIRAARAAQLSAPIYVYTTSRNVRRYRDDAIAAGGQGATTSAVELFELLGDVTPIA